MDTKGKRIKRARGNMSQTELANKIGVSKQTLYKYENDIITNIPSDKIEAIAKELDITSAYIMGWEDDEDVDTGSKLAQISKDQELLDHCIMLQGLSPKERKLIYNQIEYLHYGKD